MTVDEAASDRATNTQKGSNGVGNLRVSAYLPLPLRGLPLRSDPIVHDLLTKYNLPKGLLPKIVKSYALSDDGSFHVEHRKPCYVQFDRLVYYDEVIIDKLTYGSMSNVSRIQVKKLFIWLPVTRIKVNEKSNTVEFYVGPLSEELPANQFDDMPSCKRQACRGKAPPRSHVRQSLFFIFQIFSLGKVNDLVLGKIPRRRLELFAQNNNDNNDNDNNIC
ncbi:uncharacterized protein LOC129296219 [Prosopis cineraria]|uniref:uncharacterized protein LOC129296219 n=1 Tax=Prosopis cineraria TaxID=364024 RepID=UPI00240FC53D|nr:uncharacterized protein LOC129296219 [Prosopis cineraria]